jgi:transcriptional regulator with XRE-family HTH domain
MDIGTNIKDLRIKNGFTQKDLADKLSVTGQAVSRWENNEVEPSLDTLDRMSQLFEVSVDAILGKEKPLTEEVPEKIDKEAPVIGFCEDCHKAIREGDDFVTKSVGGKQKRSIMICDDCNQLRIENKNDNQIRMSRIYRKRGYIVGDIVAVAILIIGIIAAVYCDKSNPIWLTISILFAIIGGISGFTFTGCLFLKNNSVGEVWCDVAEWGFVKMPGVIFSLDFDGIAFLIAVKVLLWILGIILAILSILLATLIGLVLSLFVYPFALRNSYLKPEKTEIGF